MKFILWLSIARDIISLWDTQEGRKHGALPGEVFLDLVLTHEQIDAIANAHEAATVVNRTGERV